MASAIGLRHPASASCLGRHLRLAGRCPNNSSLFPPLAAVVVVALWTSSAERLFLFRNSGKSADFPELPFHGRGRGGKRHLQRRFLRKRGAAGKALLGASGLNSLSQSLTALTAPSGREPLARPGTLHFSGELSRHAKGPIPEGAVAVGDWGSWLPGVTPSGANAPAPPRGSLWVLPQSFPLPLKPSPWGRWLRPTGADGRGFSPSPCPIKPQNTP